jgi:hypothetical protein
MEKIHKDKTTGSTVTREFPKNPLLNSLVKIGGKNDEAV